MNLSIGDLAIELPLWGVIFCCLFFAFVITFLAIPSIIKVSREIGLFDSPEKRKSHTSAIPTLGGAAVFLGMVVPTVIFSNQGFDQDLKYIFIGLLILFFVGIKDDILIISARKKLVLEIFAIGIIVVLGDIRISSFHGLLGIEVLPYAVSVLFTIFVFIVIINGFNLIDGIDGLASGVGIISISTFGIWFLIIAAYAYAAFCFSVVGALGAFYYFNVYSKKNKIFLGDTGSLVIGLTVSIFATKFLETSLEHSIWDVNESAPALAFGILIVPMIDTLRVFAIRVLSGKSPFKPDRLHIHHKLLDLGLNHIKASLIIFSFNLFIIAISLSFSYLGNLRLLAIILPLSIVLTSIPSTILRYRDRMYFSEIGLFGEKSWIVPETVSNLSRYLVASDKDGSNSSLVESDLIDHQDLEPLKPEPIPEDARV